VGGVWTSGEVERSVNPCYGAATIKWCGAANTSGVDWWRGKVNGLDDAALSKHVSMDGTAGLVLQTDTALELPFVCNVINIAKG